MDSGATHVLYSIREPVARFESCFRFQHPFKGCLKETPKNCNENSVRQSRRQSHYKVFYYQCFRRIRDVGLALEDPDKYYSTPFDTGEGSAATTSTNATSTTKTTNDNYYYNNRKNNNQNYTNNTTNSLLELKNPAQCNRLLKEAFQVATNRIDSPFANGISILL